MNNKVIEAWHDIVESRDQQALEEILADTVVFHSPVVHSPQRGKPITLMYLAAAFDVLANDTFSYVREIAGEHDAVLEFRVDIDGIEVNGVDMISWNEDGRITDFKVMLRPLQAIKLIHQEMALRLQPRA